MHSGMLRVVGFFVMYLISNQYLEAMPTPTAQKQYGPWVQPCTPNASRHLLQLASKEKTSPNTNTDEIVANLISKTEETLRVGKGITKVLKTIFQDNFIIQKIRSEPLISFPQVLESESQQHTTENMFRTIYTQLSQAAVFFDHIYKALAQGDLKNELDVIIWENLSILCELKIALLKVNQNQSIPENPSIIDNLPSSMSIYQRNERCLNIIFKYKALLSGHLHWYRRNRALPNSTTATE